MKENHKYKKMKIIIWGTVFIGVCIIGIVLSYSLDRKEYPKNTISQNETTKIEDNNDVPDIKKMIEEHKTDEVFIELGKIGFISKVKYSYDEALPDYYISEIEDVTFNQNVNNIPINVTININEKWKERKEEDEKKTILVPNLIGKDRFKALEELDKNQVKNFNFEALWSNEYESKLITNVVCNQSATAGEYILPTDKITVYVYMGTLEEKELFYKEKEESLKQGFFIE